MDDATHSLRFCHLVATEILLAGRYLPVKGDERTSFHLHPGIRFSRMFSLSHFLTQSLYLFSILKGNKLNCPLITFHLTTATYV